MSKEFGTLFGVTQSGEEVRELTLDNGVLSCKIITFGAALRSVVVPGREGPVDVLLGYDTLAEYETQKGYLGAVVGRYGNRIAKGRFTLNGKTYNLATNNNGVNHLHGGNRGYSHRVWSVEELTADQVALTLDSPDGEEGYPGHFQVKITYTLKESALFLHYEAVCDQDTVCNLTNHSYFNLSGQGSGTVLDQEIKLYCSQYIPTDDTSIPLGTVDTVEGTPMDLRRPTPIGAHISEPFQQLVRGGGYDHCFVVDGQPGVMRPMAWARSGMTGIIMEAETTCPGVQFYSGNYLNDGRNGKGGAVYGYRHGFCLESQCYPDSPNQPTFPSCVLKAGEKYDEVTSFRFSLEKE